ncbi:MAG: 50S ribosomal protein L22 [Flavobacteriales bacterium AspAUS03]
MGSRKRLSAEYRKQTKKHWVCFSLQNHPTSPRKMRLMVDLIRDMDIDQALGVLKYSKKEASNALEKLLLSGLANWQLKNQDKDIEDADLYVKTVTVDNARTLKRLRPAPQGRGHRIRKRSNHVRIKIGSRKDD